MNPELDQRTEERLRRWAAGVLAGVHDAAVSPLDDPRAVKRFIRFHGIAAFIEHHRHSQNPQTNHDSSPNPTLRHEVALEMARHHEFEEAFQRLAASVQHEPIIFKGQALAHTVYPAPWYRPRCDTDVLIDEADMTSVIQALNELGYTRDEATPGRLILSQFGMRKIVGGIEHTWDVHWRFSNRPAFSEALNHGELLDTAIRVPVGSVVFRAPCIVNSLLIACLHLIGHHANDVRLIWLYDIHLLVKRLSESDLQEFLSTVAIRPEVKAACYAALDWTRRYLPAEGTDSLCRALDPGPRHRFRSRRLYATQLLEDARAVGDGQRTAFFRQHVFPSAGYMMRRFNIRHRWQLPFWYMVRIGRALPKLLRRP